LIALPGGAFGKIPPWRRRCGRTRGRSWLIAGAGSGQPEDQARSRTAGFDLHLTKPVDPDELQRRLAAP
jgi:CheY-like chemotaxis protein